VRLEKRFLRQNVLTKLCGKKMERSEKVYKLFNSIGKEKIARIKSTPPGFILNLTKDEEDYVMAEILKRKGC
jgi:hypothetical protein